MSFGAQNGIKKPLLDTQIKYKGEETRENIEKLKNYVARYESTQSMDEIDKECEIIEKTLKDLEKFPVKNPADRAEKERLFKGYSMEFESILQSFQAENFNQKQTQVQKIDTFTEELRKEQRLHAQVIENRMKEARDIMKGFSEIVSEQGIMLDTIETDVGNAEKYTGKGVDELYKTDAKQRRKKNCCKVLLVMTALAVAILVIVVCIMKL
ncbi:unnamed protein product [Blepharisma stoltei]|uniref:t-SNARE coiled-coil homology domain-containing protein n=1 Tax=Blepharisma stoltei TaxID=1481888 RepID=A0AAU9K343_9CILI|nr:unnamed protein product [Blepharisma stoltei]